MCLGAISSLHYVIGDLKTFKINFVICISLVGIICDDIVFQSSHFWKQNFRFRSRLDVDNFDIYSVVSAACNNFMSLTLAHFKFVF
jgi:hypothetical protein